MEAYGHAAHSGVEPEKGRNAILALAHQIIALQALSDYPNGLSVNVGVIEGGRLSNIVPDFARIASMFALPLLLLELQLTWAIICFVEASPVLA